MFSQMITQKLQADGGVKQYQSATIVLSVMGLSAGLMIFTMVVTGSVDAFGGNIPQVSDLLVDYLWGVALAILLGSSLVAWPISTEDRLALLTVWCCKVIVTLGVMLYYESYYWFLDSYSYFLIPRHESFAQDGLSIGAGTDNMYYLIWLTYHLLPESFHGLKVAFAFVGLVAVYLFYRAGRMFVPEADLKLFYSIALFPTVLFWSSIIGKDPIVLLGIAIYVFGSIGWYVTREFRYVIFIFSGLVIAVAIRSWLGPVLVAPLMIQAVLAERNPFLKLSYAALGLAAIGASVNQVFELFSIGSDRDLMSVIDSTAQGFSAEEGGSRQDISDDLSSLPSLAGFLPFAMFTALYRPLPGEVLNLFGWLAGIESAVLLALTALAAKRMRISDFGSPVIRWAVLLVLLWTALYSFVSFGNLGTAVRYRLQILPILLGLLIYLARRNRLESAWSGVQPT